LKIGIQIPSLNRELGSLPTLRIAHSTTAFFNGEISEILVYNRVLSANEAASVRVLSQK